LREPEQTRVRRSHVRRGAGTDHNGRASFYSPPVRADVAMEHARWFIAADPLRQ
jgi:hypothetical protein